jgi:multiple sugar transport system permease protein
MSSTVAPAKRSNVTATGRRAHAPSSNARSRERTFSILCRAVLIAFALLWLIPFAWSLVTSLRPEAEIANHPTSWWSNHWTFDAYNKVISSTDIGLWYVNSFIIAALSALFTVIVCSMVGFALAHTRFRARGAVAGLILIGLMIPTQVLILPQFLEFKLSHLLGTYWAIILPTLAAPVAVFIFRSFLMGIPDSLIEAARIDGAGWWRIYRQVTMPLCRPAISAVTIFTFVTTWNNLLWPLLVLSNTRQMTIPVGLATVQGGFGIRYAEVMASAVLGAIPLLAVFLLFQRQIVQGVASTGIK